MNRMTRSEIMEKFHREVEEGRILVGVGAGTGITAKCSEKGGADMLIIYNSGRFRMAGRGSLSGLLAYGDANKIVQEMGAEVLPVVKNTPVLAGVCGTDPFRVMDLFLKQLKDQGFNGVQNFPTVGLIDGKFRANLEETGMGYGLEVDMIREAHKLDMLTCPYVFDPEQAKAMAEAGADILVAHMGLTTWADAPEGKIKKSDVTVAKNYLSQDEMKQLNRMVTAYLDFAENMTLRHVPLTMQDWEKRLNSFIEMFDYGILQDAGKVSAEIAKLHAETEFEKYRVIQDRLFMSDFDKYMLELEESAKK